MNRHLIWIIAGTSVLGLGVPAFAAARSSGSPDDNGIPGEVRGNCDEAEHANDPDCLAVVVPGSTTGPIVVTVPSTTPNTLPSTTTPGDAVAGRPVPTNAVSAVPAANSAVDVSGPCDEVEHANDPRCTGVGIGDNSGHDGNDDGINHDVGDDNSGHDGSDDDVDHDVGDDNSGHDGADDDVNQDVGDDNSGHDGSDDVNSSSDDHSSDDDDSSGHGRDDD